MGTSPSIIFIIIGILASKLDVLLVNGKTVFISAETFRLTLNIALFIPYDSTSVVSLLNIVPTKFNLTGILGNKLLRNELIKNFREYKRIGEITLLDKENMEHMFAEYFNLGGNGMMHEVYDEFKQIPIKIVK